MHSDKFPNTIQEVVYQHGQFSCVPNGAFNRVEISDFTKENIKKGLMQYYLEGDKTNGALFFTRGKFNRKYLFTDSVKHNFYK